MAAQKNVAKNNVVNPYLYRNIKLRIRIRRILILEACYRVVTDLARSGSYLDIFVNIYKIIK
jgi:hypothetical protein